MQITESERESTSQIIVGVDSTGALTAAVDWATRAAAARGSKLRVLHGFSPDRPGFAFGMGAESESIRLSNKHMLDRVAAHIHAVDARVQVETVQSEDYPAKLLVRASAAADLVVLGAQGDSHLGFSAIGQTAAQVASHSAAPVVVVRGGSAKPAHQRITVGLHMAEDVPSPLGWAFDEAQRTGSALVVVHAWQPRDSQDPHLRKSAWADYADSCEQRVRRWIETQRASHADVQVSVEITRGNPSRVLAEHSGSTDLMVVGARGSGGFDGLRLGQVARDLLGHSKSTLVITR